MTVHLKLDLNSPAELDAFGAFCIAVAADKRANPPKASIYDRLWGLGGIDKASNSSWQARTASDETSAAPVSDTADAVVFAFDPATPDLMNSTAAAPQTAPAADAPKRERGKPSPGHKRRTNEEIAEDKAADEADAANNTAKAAGADQIAAISTGEERVGPEDDAATQEADAADEAAETAASTAERVAEGKSALTLDSVRNASAPYSRKYGIPAASEDFRKLLGTAMIDLDEAEFAHAIETLTKAVAENPFERPVVDGSTDTAAKSEAVPITKKDLIDVMLAYALKYDGQNKDTAPEAMPITTEDAQKCFSMRFGTEIKALKELKPEQYPQALADLKSMLTKNPFGRTAVTK